MSAKRQSEIYIKKLAGITLLGIGFVLGFLAYFVVSPSSEVGVFYDGLGRKCYEVPAWIAWVTRGAITEWRGIVWFIVDMIVGIMLLLGGLALIGAENRTRNRE